jgi:hypothetical protein
MTDTPSDPYTPPIRKAGVVETLLHLADPVQEDLSRTPTD